MASCRQGGTQGLVSTGGTGHVRACNHRDWPPALIRLVSSGLPRWYGPAAQRAGRCKNKTKRVDVQAGPGFPHSCTPAPRHTASGRLRPWHPGAKSSLLSVDSWWANPSMPWGWGTPGQPFPTALVGTATPSLHTHTAATFPHSPFILRSTRPCFSNLLKKKSIYWWDRTCPE